MTERRIALIIGGGVSLGSYEAGVLEELMHTLDELNKRAPEDGGPLYVVDVITGGSAGSMSGAVLARGMMCDSPGRRRLLHKAWVDLIGVEGLLEQPTPRNAIFSTAVIDRIRDEVLLDRDAQDASLPGPREQERASFAPPSLRLGFSISNMNGVDYGIALGPGRAGAAQSFGCTFFSEMAEFVVEGAGKAPWEQWSDLSNAAIASGAFPIGFQPRSLRRPGSSYPGSRIFGDSAYAEWAPLFIDGGLFNNEPLREAIHLAAEADEHAASEGRPAMDERTGPGRLFILIDPFVNASRHLRDVSTDASLTDHTVRMITMIRGESTAKDFLRSHRVNNEIEWRDGLVSAMAALAPALDPGALAGAEAELDRVVGSVRLTKSRHSPAKYAGASDADLVERSWTPAAVEACRRARVDPADPRVSVVKKMVFALDSAAALQNKRPLTPHLIGADPGELAGATMEGFGGFFVRDWREHDYRKGRLEARERLPGILAYEPGAVAPDPTVDLTIPPPWKGFPGASLRAAPRAHVVAVRDLIAGKFEDALRAALKAPPKERTGFAALAAGAGRAVAGGLVNFGFWIYGRRKIRTAVERWMLGPEP